MKRHSWREINRANHEYLIVICNYVLSVRGVGHSEQKQRVGHGARDGKRRDGVELLVRKDDARRIEDHGIRDGWRRLQGDAAPKQRRLAVFIDGRKVVGVRKREKRLRFGPCGDRHSKECACDVIPRHFKRYVVESRPLLQLQGAKGEENGRGEVKLLLLRTEAMQRTRVVVPQIKEEMQIG
jgi:hypothetical protein